MNKLILGLVVFFGVHAISLLALGWRDRMVERVGLRVWRRYYSIAAAVGLYLLIAGYGAARGEDRVLYVTPAAFRYLAAILMLPAFTLALASVFRGRISARAKHPLLVATMLWSVAHVLTNGTVANVLLFGSFLVWSVAVRISLDHRPQRPPIALPASSTNDVIVVIGGLAAYVLVAFWLHARLLGVAPLAGT
jgi:uncharacterized membrane protein